MTFQPARSIARRGVARLATVLALALSIAACASAPSGDPGSTPTSVASRFTEEQISATRVRVSYIGAPGATAEQNRAATLRRAAQITLDKGNEWFEIADQASGENKHSIEIVMGKGESLAGGASRQYDARETLRGGATS